jgi:hypothetical protein
MSNTLPELGIIEGYFGKPWNWVDRTHVMQTLAPHSYRFFIYAPKADEHLRRRWKEPHPRETQDALAAFAASCRGAGVRFGVGLSPFDDLAILFDDMRGDIPDLAQRQAAIIGFVAGCTKASRLIVCPSYYTDEVVLDRVFGARPANYLEDLGRLLDPKVDVFWTGEEVCARAFSPGHLQDVAGRLRRKPFLWDNYPVNDGPRMSQFLHVRGFTGRPASMAAHVSAHAINPALQPHLSLIPALTLVDSYTQGDRYCYMSSFRSASRSVMGEDCAKLIENDLLSLQDAGLANLGERVQRLRAKYEAYAHPAAQEVVAWLDGKYAITSAEMLTS